jgi:hypothetical protein
LATLPEWKKAKIVFSNPDSAQKPVRELALKVDYIVTPNKILKSRKK